jgi:hypothetical protein
MKKQRRYLKDLIPVNINELVLATGYYELQIGDKLLSLAPERHPNGLYYVTTFKNHLRQHEAWELSARPHKGRLQHGGHIPYHCDEVYYVLSQGRRFAHLFICPDTMVVGTRIDFFPKDWAAYPRKGSKDESFESQCKEMEQELFGEKDEFTAEYEKRLKKSYLGI